MSLLFTVQVELLQLLDLFNVLLSKHIMLHFVLVYNMLIILNEDSGLES
jgi:hypothetical protein